MHLLLTVSYKNNMKSKKTILIRHKIMIAFFTFCLFAFVPIRTQASQGSDIQKMLKYINKKEFVKADKIAQKYKGKKAKEKKYKKQLSKKAKKAFIKVLNSYRLYDSENLFDSKHRIRPHLCGYFVKDLDGKGQPELCISYGKGGMDTFLYVYRYSKGKARFVDKAYCDGCTWHDIPNKKGVIWSFGRQGCSFTSVYTLKKNKLVIKECVGYAGFPFAFDSHVTLKQISSRRTIGVLSYSGIR